MMISETEILEEEEEPKEVEAGSQTDVPIVEVQYNITVHPTPSLEEEMATYSSILAWKIPWTEEPGRLQSMGTQRVGHDRATEHRIHRA